MSRFQRFSSYRVTENRSNWTGGMLCQGVRAPRKTRGTRKLLLQDNHGSEEGREQSRRVFLAGPRVDLVTRGSAIIRGVMTPLCLLTCLKESMDLPQPIELRCDLGAAPRTSDLLFLRRITPHGGERDGQGSRSVNTVRSSNGGPWLLTRLKE